MKTVMFGIMLSLLVVSSINANLPAFCLVEYDNGTIEENYYDDRQFLCCNKKLVNRFVNGQRRECCDRTGGVWEPFFFETEICCGVHLEKSIDRNGRQYSCCQFTKKLFIPEKECCGNVGPCCDSTRFDPLEFLCCNGQLFARTNDTVCCGNSICPPKPNVVVLHNSTCGQISCQKNEKKCCNGHLQSGDNVFDKSVECHNTTLYDPKTKKCCPSNGEKLSWKQSCCENSNHICPLIFGESVDKQSDLCDGKLFDTLNQQCCGDKILKKSLTCCGGEELHSDSVCCPASAQYGHKHEKRIAKHSKTDNDCCVGYGGKIAPYNNYREQCFKGQVIQQTDLCGKDSYDKSKDLCCKHTTLYVGKKSTFTCCSNSLLAYGPEQICCGGTIYNITSDTARCSNGKAVAMAPSAKTSDLPRFSCILCYGQPKTKRHGKNFRDSKNAYVIEIRGVREKKKGYIIRLKFKIPGLKKAHKTRLTVSSDCQCEPKKGTEIILSSKHHLQEFGQSSTDTRSFRRKIRKFIRSLRLMH